MRHRIGIIGCGYVGTACDYHFSLLPNTEVRCYDKYKASEAHDTVVNESDVIFVCVPTPMAPDGSCDTSIVKHAVARIDKRARTEKVIVIKSTVPPGTTDWLQTTHDKHHIFFNPEFLTEANWSDDFANQRLIVIGESIRGPNPKLSRIYHAFQAGQHQDKRAVIFNCNAATAEMVKYTANCFLASKLSFFNEIYQICQQSNVAYNVLRDVLKYDERIGTSHMQVPGPDGEFGYSLSCMPKDINALTAYAKERGVDTTMLSAAWEKNLKVRKTHDWETLPQVTGKYKSA